MTFTYKGYTARKGPYNGCSDNWWTVWTPQGRVCIQKGGTRREVQQAIERFIQDSERRAG